MLNKKWSELSDDKKEELLGNYYLIDGRTGNAPKSSGECIVDFSNGYSVAGHVEITDVEDIITIEDDAVIYKSDV